jgi:hypothetical protein
MRICSFVSLPEAATKNVVVSDYCYLDLSHLEIFTLPAQHAHLRKPFTPIVLMRNVRESLDESSGHREKEKNAASTR